ncbi:ABC transporter permease [Kineosporia sp. A_224]|uniref:ABC transporter permease n=1 Tax=Kineosporia sp. A_224 TaxID=1962180 RepID=UPI0035107BB7
MGAGRGRRVGRYALRRAGTAAGTAVFVLVVNFFLFRLLPGDPIGLITRGRNMDADQIRALRAQLNKPIWQQFLDYASNPFSTGVDSVKYSRPVWGLIGERVGPTLLLVGTATVIATAVGLWIGIRAGWRPGQGFDRGSTAVTLLLYAMPEFWLGMLLLIAFGTGIGPLPALFPIGGISTPGVDTSTPAGWLDVGRHLVLPATTIVLGYVAEYSLIMRASLVDEVHADYVTTARAKGLKDAEVRRRHALRNAMLPTSSLVLLNIGFVVSGAITVETVFSWPGLGLLTYDALRGPDIPLLQALFLLFSLSVIAVNLVADLLYGVIDPRVRT